MAKKDVYWNITDKPIIFNIGIIVDTFGGPARGDTVVMIQPGQGIDVSIIGLSKKKPKKVKYGT